MKKYSVNMLAMAGLASLVISLLVNIILLVLVPGSGTPFWRLSIDIIRSAGVPCLICLQFNLVLWVCWMQLRYWPGAALSELGFSLIGALFTFIGFFMLLKTFSGRFSDAAFVAGLGICIGSSVVGYSSLYIFRNIRTFLLYLEERANQVGEKSNQEDVS